MLAGMGLVVPTLTIPRAIYKDGMAVFMYGQPP